MLVPSCSGVPRLGPTMMQLQGVGPGWVHHLLDQHRSGGMALVLVVG
jgi:hypothetical protein